MPKLIIEKIENMHPYGKDMYKVVKLIDSYRLSLLHTLFDEPSMLQYIHGLPNNYKYEITNRASSIIPKGVVIAGSFATEVNDWTSRSVK